MHFLNLLVKCVICFLIYLLLSSLSKEELSEDSAARFFRVRAFSLTFWAALRLMDLLGGGGGGLLLPKSSDSDSELSEFHEFWELETQ